MRLGILVIALAACSSSATAGSMWPKPRPHEVDGGESLAPRPAARAITALVEDERAAERPADKPAATAVPAARGATPDKPAADKPVTTTPEEPITTDDIVIEIED